MIKNDLMCDCGKLHSFSNSDVIIKKNCFDLFVYKVASIDAKKFLIISEEKNLRYSNKLLKILRENKKNVEILIVNKESICVSFINNIKTTSDCVIAIGDEKIVSAAKYYSSKNDAKLCVFLIGEFLDYTFSKFARLKGKCFYDFYVTIEPHIIYIDYVINSFKVEHVYYILSKYLALFDNIVGECVYKINDCKKIKQFIKNSLLKYQNSFSKNSIIQNVNNIWCLVRFGLAMSYFSQTKCFFGGEKAFIDLMQVKNKEISHLRLSYFSLNLITLAYSKFYSKSQGKIVLNMTKAVNNLSNYLNIPFLIIVKRLLPTEMLIANNRIKARLDGYLYFLKSVLKKCIKKMELVTNKLGDDKSNKPFIYINKEEVINSLVFAPCLSSSISSLTLMFSFGYLTSLLV